MIVLYISQAWRNNDDFTSSVDKILNVSNNDKMDYDKLLPSQKSQNTFPSCEETSSNSLGSQSPRSEKIKVKKIQIKTFNRMCRN
jgi:hypothetical protein